MLVIDSLKSLFGISQPKTTESTDEFRIPKWMSTASEASGWDTGLLTESTNFYWYMRAYETAPDYTKPLLSSKQKALISYDHLSAFRNEFEREYQVNKDVIVRTESDGDGFIRVRILVDDFERWASGSRLAQGFTGETLGLGGKFYVDLANDIRDAFNNRHLMFDTVITGEEYVTEVPISCSEVEERLK